MFAAPILIPARDPFLRVIKNFEGSTMPIDKARRQIEVAPASEPTESPRVRLPPPPEPSRSIKSAVLRVVVDPKGKAVVLSPKNPKRKRRLTKTEGGKP